MSHGDLDQLEVDDDDASHDNNGGGVRGGSPLLSHGHGGNNCYAPARATRTRWRRASLIHAASLARGDNFGGSGN